jgi:hypothetical protein
MMLENGALRAAVLGALAMIPAFAAEDSTYKTLRDAGVGDARVVENIMLRRDNAILTLKSGSIGFTAPVEGRDTVAVFVGEGSFVFQPALNTEKDHLKGVLGQELVKRPSTVRCSASRTKPRKRSAGRRRRKRPIRSSTVS